MRTSSRPFEIVPNQDSRESSYEDLSVIHLVSTGIQMSKRTLIARRNVLAGLASAGLSLPLIRRSIAIGPPPKPKGVRPGRRSGIRVLQRSTVFSHPASDPYDLKNLYGFNHAASIVSLPDGRLLAAWFSGPFEASVHQVILASYSPDQGRTWTPAEVFQDFPRTSDFDPAFIADGTRTWFFCSVGRWNRYPHVKNEEKEVGVNSFKVFERHSDDSGRTWSHPRVIYENAGAGCRSNGIKLSTGELILPVHGYLNAVAGVLKSTDGGRTWKRYGEVKTTTVAHEPSCAELATGEIMMVLRTGDGFLWQAFSRDKGESWSAAERTQIVAARSSHNLFRLRDGRVVLTHNPSKTLRTPLTMRISKDGGKEWGEPTVIAKVSEPSQDDPEWSRQVSYPSVTALHDDSLVVVWGELYLSDREQYGDIHSARVQI
jgi:predicted neuraminidase